MANAWAITDSTLQAMLTDIKDGELSIAGWTLHLYKNDYTPIPATIESDFTECDFTGYAAQVLNEATWGDVTVSLHVASTTQTTDCVFTAGALMVGTQTVYGYYVLTAADALAWSERFAAPRTLSATDVLKVKAIFRYGVFPS